VKDVKVEGSNHTFNLPQYIPPHVGKAKVPKDIDENKVMLHTPFLLDKITFEGVCLGCVPLLKLEDWDLVDT